MKNHILRIVFLLVLFCFAGAANAQNQTATKDTLDTKLIEKLIRQKLDSIRVKKKISKYIYNDTIYKAAKFHAEYMLNSGNFSHMQTDSKTKTPTLRLQKFGIEKSYYGENIAYVYSDFLSIGTVITYKEYVAIANEFVLLWVKSKPHYQNICDAKFKMDALAISYSYETQKIYAVHDFTALK